MHTILERPDVMSREWEKRLPKELQDYIEAQRQAERATVLAELALGSIGIGRPIQVKSPPHEGEPDRVSVLTVETVETSERAAGKHRQNPRGLGLKLVRDAANLEKPGTIVSTTDLRRTVESRTGHKLSFNTVRRAIENLCASGEMERIEETDAYRITPRLRSVK